MSLLVKPERADVALSYRWNLDILLEELNKERIPDKAG
jgi:hypothetical protein